MASRLRVGALFLVLILLVGVLPMPVGAAPTATPAPQSPGYSTQFGETGQVSITPLGIAALAVGVILLAAGAYNIGRRR